MHSEVRLERLRPAEVRDALAAAPIAWVPLGAIEFHAEHLPLGTDGFTAQAVVERAARIAGGVVLPWSAVTFGTLHLPWSLRYDPAIVEATIRATLEQLIGYGAKVVVVHTGHGPLDLSHLIKRVCAEVAARAQAADPAVRTYGLCYLELNAALGHGLGTDWPVAVDHGSILETSWMLALDADLVRLDRLPGDPEATTVGVYGPNPRERASAAFGEAQLVACARLLAERATRLVRGEQIDQLDDLRGFVTRYWPEPLELGGRAGDAGEAVLTLRNPGPVSRYLTRLTLRLDGADVRHDGITLRNPTVGEAGTPVAAASLGPEAGFYVRRNQLAEVQLPDALAPGRHDVELELGLAGVTTTRLGGTIDLS
jgi:creatinine amidohydrolase